MAVNKGEKFRKKLVVIIDKLGFTVQRNRDPYTDIYGEGHPFDTTTLNVIDVDQVATRFQEVLQYLDIGGANQNDPGMKQLLYAAEAGTVTPTTIIKPIIDEGDELIFDGKIHRVSRQKPLPISNVNVFRHISCTYLRPL